jgi:hypothetical protein
MIKKAFWGPVKYQPQLFHTAFAGALTEIPRFFQIPMKVLAGSCGGTRLSPCPFTEFLSRLSMPLLGFLHFASSFWYPPSLRAAAVVGEEPSRQASSFHLL